MAKQLPIVLVIAAVVGGVYFFVNYEIQSQQENGKTTCWRIVPRAGPAAPRRSAGRSARQGRCVPPSASPPSSSAGSTRPSWPTAGERRADAPLPRFDLMAIQGVRGKNQGVLVRLVEQINAASGRSYDFATCPTQQRDALEHYSAFVFDRARIDVDRTTVHFVEDRRGRFRIKPLVGSFRVRGPDPAQAFTFTLINVETDPDHAAAELDVLAEVFRAVREDGRNEDDIILLGDLESDDQHLGQLGKLLGVTPLCPASPPPPAAANRWTTSSWTAGRPASSPAGSRWWT